MLQPEIAKKSIKPPILAFKVIEFGANQEPVYDFLLVITLALSGTVTEIRRDLLAKNRKFCLPPFI